ncbi:EAL domain-containing protein [Alkalinema sp. FACHB-956]|uniref:EAL domain-containing protein n=1 Tax=Alkalinema sp. FACHB-956 TaxID=2692768 RepID=UPI0016888996|nr:EAL domain-containing protein [Alkalinema sp. FACHB-956]MBD2330119.1 EAL domain-containing protein [Alkalinema sp. FACHB-956]
MSQFVAHPEAFTVSRPRDFSHLSQDGDASLWQSIHNGEFKLYYQPIVHLLTGAVHGLEVLLRWNHPVQGLLAPTEFLPVMEQTGSLLRLDRWVLRSACQQLRQWQMQGVVNSDFFISVNFSASQFEQPDLLPYFKVVLDETQLLPRSLKVEITESKMMQNLPVVVKNLQALQQLQVQISLDDFGTGYSSLSYLHQLPIDTLKLDSSFLSHLQDTPIKLKLLTAIVQMSQTLGLPLVAEGIETKGQLAQLKLLGCEFGQGYWFQVPREAEVITDYLTYCGHRLP